MRHFCIFPYCLMPAKIMNYMTNSKILSKNHPFVCCPIPLPFPYPSKEKNIWQFPQKRQFRGAQKIRNRAKTNRRSFRTATRHNYDRKIILVRAQFTHDCPPSTTDLHANDRYEPSSFLTLWSHGIFHAKEENGPCQRNKWMHCVSLSLTRAGAKLKLQVVVAESHIPQMPF